MPTPDLPRRLRPLGRAYLWLQPRGRKRRKPGDEGEKVPVEPNRPNNLSGGAEAELDFGDEER